WPLDHLVRTLASDPRASVGSLRREFRRLLQPDAAVLKQREQQSQRHLASEASKNSVCVQCGGALAFDEQRGRTRTYDTVTVTCTVCHTKRILVGMRFTRNASERKLRMYVSACLFNKCPMGWEWPDMRRMEEWPETLQVRPGGWE